MKNLFLLLVFVLASLTESQAQCTPNYSYNGPGFYTNDGDSTLDLAYLNQPYSEVVSLYVPLTYDIGGFTVNIDSVKITDIQGLPDGIGSACNPANCFWLSGDTGCITLAGLPTNSGQVGENQLTIKMTFYGLGTSANEDVTIFKMTVLDTTTTSPNSIFEKDLKGSSFKLFPNPAKEKLVLSFNEEEASNIQVLDINGKVLLTETKKASESKLSIDVSSLSPGMYHLRNSTAFESKSMRFVIKP